MKNLQLLPLLGLFLYAAMTLTCMGPLSDTETSKDGGITLTDPMKGPAAGNPEGQFPIPPEGALKDVSHPDQILGDGTPGSITSDDFINAVAQGGVITFNGGPNPVTLILKTPARVFNNKPDLVIDGGGLITLSGGGKTRIIYMNTSDPDLVWTTDHAQDQEHPQLTVQNLTFIDGYARQGEEGPNSGGGGALWVYGGRLKVINCRFFHNLCSSTGPDVGGGAIRVFSQHQNLPVYVINTTFGGAQGLGNEGSNGGALSNIGVSWAIYNSLFSYNQALGSGGNPASPGTLGGGSGGAIYNDGNTMTLALYGNKVEHNKVKAFGSAIFFVTNNHLGNLHIQDSVIYKNEGGSWNTLPGISMHSDTPRSVINSIIN